LVLFSEDDERYGADSTIVLGAAGTISKDGMTCMVWGKSGGKVGEEKIKVCLLTTKRKKMCMIRL
jgi:hypothetical protein